MVNLILVVLVFASGLRSSEFFGKDCGDSSSFCWWRGHLYQRWCGADLFMARRSCRRVGHHASRPTHAAARDLRSEEFRHTFLFEAGEGDMLFSSLSSLCGLAVEFPVPSCEAFTREKLDRFHSKGEQHRWKIGPALAENGKDAVYSFVCEQVGAQ